MARVSAILFSLSLLIIRSSAQETNRAPSVSGPHEWLGWLRSPYQGRSVNPVDTNNSPRIYELLHADIFDLGFLQGSTVSIGGRYPVYEAGIQLPLPIRNRVAQADLTRDLLAKRSYETRQIQLENQVALEIDAAAIALRRSRAAYDAAARAR